MEIKYLIKCKYFLAGSCNTIELRCVTHLCGWVLWQLITKYGLE